MEILITNDDGWGAKGIVTLLRLMEQFGHVTVIAPDGTRSGMSNAITFSHITMQKVEETEHHSIYTTNGTPSDCVKLGIHIIYGGKRPDLLVSGINHGSNAAINVIYSGTMGAVFVGAENGIKSIGFSIDDMSADPDLTQFEPYITQITKDILAKRDVPYGMCWNVNAPIGEIHGIRPTRQCKGYWDEEVSAHQEADGSTYYLLGGAFHNNEPEADDTDEWALKHGYISLTVSTIDTTWKEKNA